MNEPHNKPHVISFPWVKYSLKDHPKFLDIEAILKYEIIEAIKEVSGKDVLFTSFINSQGELCIFED